MTIHEKQVAILKNILMSPECMSLFEDAIDSLSSTPDIQFSSLINLEISLLMIKEGLAFNKVNFENVKNELLNIYKNIFDEQKNQTEIIELEVDENDE